MNTPPDLLDPALLERIKGLGFLARRLVEGALHGLHRSPMRGLSIEFAQHREYTPGDELKHLDWKVIGRSERYVVKQYEQETNLRAVLLVDGSRSMAYGGQTSADSGQPSAGETDAANPQSKYRYAQKLAAAFSYLLLQQGESVAAVVTSDKITRQIPPRAAMGHLVSICHALAEHEPAGRTDLPGVMSQLASRLARRSLMVLISDLLDEPAEVLDALGRLHHRGHEVIVFHVLDRRELDFNLGSAAHGITVVRDMETGEEFEAEPALIREMVQAEVHAYCQTLDAGARRHGLHLVRCPTDRPVEEVLVGYLHYRMRGTRR